MHCNAERWSLVVLGLLAGCGGAEWDESLFERNVKLERQISVLGDIGLELNSGVTDADLTAFHARAILESKPYLGLVEVMGIDIEREPFTPICDRLWMCDYERVEDHGAYRDVLVRLEIMTAGWLKLARPMDHVDVEAGRAWLEFDFQGQLIHWDFLVQDDWLDPSVFVRFDELLAQAESPLRVYVNNTDYGQSALLAAFTSEEKAEFDKLTKIKLEPIEK